VHDAADTVDPLPNVSDRTNRDPDRPQLPARGDMGDVARTVDRAMRFPVHRDAVALEICRHWSGALLWLRLKVLPVPSLYQA
jgi:hypothetical protein